MSNLTGGKCYSPLRIILSVLRGIRMGLCGRKVVFRKSFVKGVKEKEERMLQVQQQFDKIIRK